MMSNDKTDDILYSPMFDVSLVMPLHPGLCVTFEFGLVERHGETHDPVLFDAENDEIYHEVPPRPISPDIQQLAYRLSSGVAPLRSPTAYELVPSSGCSFTRAEDRAFSSSHAIEFLDDDSDMFRF